MNVKPGAVFVPCLLAAGVLLAAEPFCEEAKGWKRVPAVSDEFDGKALDKSKWDDWCASFPGRVAAGMRGEPCVNGFRFAPDNVSVEDGELVLTARLLTDEERKSHHQEHLRHGPYATSIVKSRKKQVYGYFEIRAKTMKACVSNAFWLYDPHSDDPRVKYTAGDVSEEIDIFEVTGRPDSRGRNPDCSRKYYNTFHLYCTPYLEGVINAKKINPPDRAFVTKVDFDFCDDYHVYGLLWTPEKLVWYLDGKPVKERKNDGLFHRPLHVTLDSEVFVSWFGVPDPKDLPAKFRIDYVRVWECPVSGNVALRPRMKIEKDSYDWFERHNEAMACARARKPEIVFVGDSITHFWAGGRTLGGEAAHPRWKQKFGAYRTLNLGYGWDRTGNVLWRLDHGEMDGLDPKLVVLHIGGNNFSATKNYPGNNAEETAEGVLAVLDKIRTKVPQARIVTMAIFPFGEKPDAPHRVKARAANKILAVEVPKRPNTVFLDITDKQVGADGIYPKSRANDFVHPTDAGYDIWYEALKPYLP